MSPEPFQRYRTVAIAVCVGLLGCMQSARAVVVFDHAAVLEWADEFSGLVGKYEVVVIEYLDQADLGRQDYAVIDLQPDFIKSLLAENLPPGLPVHLDGTDPSVKITKVVVNNTPDKWIAYNILIEGAAFLNPGDPANVTIGPPGYGIPAATKLPETVTMLGGYTSDIDETTLTSLDASDVGFALEVMLVKPGEGFAVTFWVRDVGTFFDKATSAMTNDPAGYTIFQAYVVPEPGTLALAGLGLIGLVGLRRR